MGIKDKGVIDPASGIDQRHLALLELKDELRLARPILARLEAQARNLTALCAIDNLDERYQNAFALINEYTNQLRRKVEKASEEATKLHF